MHAAILRRSWASTVPLAGEAPRQPIALLAAHRLRGELDTETGRFDSAQTHLDASVALADACEAPYERALTLLAMAALRAAQCASDDANRLLDEAKSICTPLGAKPRPARRLARRHDRSVRWSG